jgi:hypothetical protein
MYKSDSADSCMSLCNSKTLGSQEKSMKELFAGFAKEGAEFSTRKVNDNPQGGEGGLESGMVHDGKEPLEMYFASWKWPKLFVVALDVQKVIWSGLFAAQKSQGRARVL